MNIKELAIKAKKASRSLALISTVKKNEALDAICTSLIKNADFILKENEKDLLNAKEKGTSDAMTDRLRLTEERIASMAEGVKKIIDLDDPVGETICAKTLPNGLKVSKVTVPMGLIGVIYESRPNVSVDITCLSLKNVCSL